MQRQQTSTKKNNDSKAVPAVVQQELADEISPPTLQKLFADTAVAKLLDFLTLYRHFDYSLTEISRNSGVPWRTLHRVWPVLEQYDVVKLTRKIDRAKLYTLNGDSTISRMLTKLSLEIASFDQELIPKEAVLRGTLKEKSALQEVDRAFEE